MTSSRIFALTIVLALVSVVSMGYMTRVGAATTLKDDAYAFAFDQQGLMAGVSIEGTRISRIQR